MNQHTDGPDDAPHFLIDGPGPFAPIEELIAHRNECAAMLLRYPNHPQWEGELESVEQAIAGQLVGHPPAQT